MNALQLNSLSPGSDGDVPGEAGRAAITHGSACAAPETPRPSSSTHSGAGSATRERVPPALPWSRQDIRDAAEDVLGLAFLIVASIGALLIAGVLS